MDNIKNAIIALLTGLLALTLFTQSAQSATAKTYDAVKLIQYAACLDDENDESGQMLEFDFSLRQCVMYKP